MLALMRFILKKNYYLQISSKKYKNVHILTNQARLTKLTNLMQKSEFLLVSAVKTHSTPVLSLTNASRSNNSLTKWWNHRDFIFHTKPKKQCALVFTLHFCFCYCFWFQFLFPFFRIFILLLRRVKQMLRVNQWLRRFYGRRGVAFAKHQNEYSVLIELR